MPDATDPFAELTRRGHQLFAAAVQAWEQAARSLAEAGRRPGGPPEVRASLEAAYEFAAQMLAEQRAFAKSLMSASTQALGAAAGRGRPEAGPPPADAAPGREATPAVGAPDGQPATQAIQPTSPDADAGTAGTATVSADTTAKKTAAKKIAAKKTAAKKAAPTTPAAPSGGTATATKGPAKRTAAKKSAATTSAAATPPAPSTPPTKPAAKKAAPRTAPDAGSDAG